MGEEKLDNAVYLIRGLYDFADMAQAKKRPRDAKWANDARRQAAREASTTRGGTRTSSQYADSLKAGDAASSRSTGSA